MDSARFWDLGWVCRAIVEAGLAGLAMQKQVLGQGAHKADRSLVTEADVAVEDLLKGKISAAVPSANFLAEESIDGQDPAALVFSDNPLYIIDPIDGTAVFAAGMTGWGVSLGLAVEGRLAEGAVFFPGTGELFVSSGGQALYGRFALDSSGVPVVEDAGRSADILGPLVVAPAQPVKMLAITQYIAKGGPFKVPFTLVSTASAVLSILGTARGGFRGYLVKAKVWDIAGAWPVLRDSGASTTLVASGQRTELDLRNGPWVWDKNKQNYLSTDELLIMTHDADVEAAVLEAGPESVLG